MLAPPRSAYRYRYSGPGPYRQLRRRTLTVAERLLTVGGGAAVGVPVAGSISVGSGEGVSEDISVRVGSGEGVAEGATVGVDVGDDVAVGDVLGSGAAVPDDTSRAHPTVAVRFSSWA
jgi:hypothetical protein